MDQSKNNTIVLSFLFVIMLYFSCQILVKASEFLIGGPFLSYELTPYIHTFWLFIFLWKSYKFLLNPVYDLKRRKIFVVSILSITSYTLYYFFKDYEYDVGLCGVAFFDGTFDIMVKGREVNEFYSEIIEFALVLLFILLLSFKLFKEWRKKV